MQIKRERTKQRTAHHNLLNDTVNLSLIETQLSVSYQTHVQ
jgi:hypothetical protein